MITKEQYLEAQAVVEKYQREVFKESEKSEKQKSVRLSKWGKEMQKPHNKKGIIVSKHLAGMTDYTVEVLWEDGKQETMHEHQVEYAIDSSQAIEQTEK